MQREKPHLIRWLFGLGAAAATLTCVLAAALCIRSYFAQEIIVATLRSGDDPVVTWRYWRLVSGNGGIAFQLHTFATTEWFAVPVREPDDFGISSDGLFAPGLRYARDQRVGYPYLQPNLHSYSTWWCRWGFSWAQGQPDTRTTIYSLTLPLPALVVAAGIMPVVWWTRWRRARNREARLCCINCGYDLRASPDRCPECGKCSVVHAA